MIGVTVPAHNEERELDRVAAIRVAARDACWVERRCASRGAGQL